ncbi:MAG: electron transfer flavoprotein subunit beta/FixA family protein [bacterium]
MKILVCIKQIPDMESKFKINAEGDWFNETDVSFWMNEYDEYAVEQSIQLKEQLGNEPDVTVLSVGPDRVIESIKKALAMGCDRGVHIKDDEAFRKDPYQIASIIYEFAKDKNFDVIFTGMQSQDRGSAQVGVLLAEMLNYSCVTTVVNFAYENGVINAKRELEGGIKSVVKVKTPAVVTCQLGLNTPRYPTLPNIMKAKKKELLTVNVSDLLKEDALEKTEKFYYPEKKGVGMVIEGDVAAMVDQLINVLKEKTTVVK